MECPSATNLDYSQRSGSHFFETQGCSVCHRATNEVGPSLRGIFGQRRELNDGRVIYADEAYLRDAILEPSKHVVTGYKDLMPSYRDKLRPGEVEAIIDYMKTLR